MIRESEPSPHPPRSVLEALIDEDREVSGPERRHLEECETCRARVHELVEAEKTLIELLRRERSEPVSPRERPPCPITRDTLWEYADWLAHRPSGGESPGVQSAELPQEFRSVEQHLEACDRCVDELLAMQKFFAGLKQA